MVLGAMRCPECGGDMERDQPQVVCVNGHAVPIVEGYLDATGARAVASAATAKTFESFGYEWTTFSSVMEEDELYAEHYLRDLDLPGLVGRLGLDAGCGRARYSRFLAPHLGQLVALDGSDAVRSAAQNMRDVKNAVVIRSDLRRAPFADESFGFVASYGVLHHLEDPRAGFDRLVRLLAPGGVMTLYLYSRPDRRGPRGIGLAAAAWLRRYTVRMPHPVLRASCYPLAALLWLAVVLPGRVGDAAHVEKLSSLPMGTYRDKPLRSLVLDTFDRLSAPVEHRYVWADLAPWFEEAGLVVDAHRDESGWFIVAHRPGS
jgi:SAM-dependent methyltransferase